MDLMQAPSATIAVSTQLDGGGGRRVLLPFKIRDYRLLVAAVALSIFATGMWDRGDGEGLANRTTTAGVASSVAGLAATGLVAFRPRGRHRR